MSFSLFSHCLFSILLAFDFYFTLLVFFRVEKNGFITVRVKIDELTQLSHATAPSHRTLLAVFMEGFQSP